MNISIIVPNYNHLKFLSQRLDTIFNQTFQDFEVILLDDCSIDGSWEYLKTFENHTKVSHCIRNETNSGSPFKQWKKGIDLAKYDWIWIAESDDFSDLTFLEKIINKTLDDDIGIVFCRSDVVDKFGEISETLFTPTSLGITEDKFMSQNRNGKINGKIALKKYFAFINLIPNASACIFRKPSSFPMKALEMKKVGDWVFWIERAAEGNIVYVAESLNYFRTHPNVTRAISSANDFQGYLLEISDAMNFAKNKLNLYSIQQNPLKYSYMGKYIFNYLRNKGRLSREVIFPKIPKIFLASYYLEFIRSLFRN